MRFPTVEELGKEIAENALDGYIYKGRTLRQWVDAISKQSDKLVSGGTYQCFHCCTNGVIWDNDFDFSDYGYDGEGIVHVCHCVNCGAEIEYKISIPDEEEEDASKES